MAEPGRSSAAKKREARKKCQEKEARRNTAKAADQILSAKVNNIPHPKNQSNCTLRGNQANLTTVASPTPAPPPLPAVQSLLYQQQAMHLGLENFLL